MQQDFSKHCVNKRGKARQEYNFSALTFDEKKFAHHKRDSDIANYKSEF